MLESSPAAGVIGTKALSDRIGLDNAIAFDMGGTTAKAGVIHQGRVLMTGGAMIGGYATGLPVQIPMIDIQEVGTGGGSIARVGPGGALRVGPQSAGAEPGPVCYGRGGAEPTVTDANLILGRLGADRFLGGEMALDVEGARRAIRDKVAIPLGRELGIATVVVPPAPGHFSACGMLVADLRRDFVKTWFTPLATAPFATIEEFFAAMEGSGLDAMNASAVALADIAVTRAADMRYVGQEHAVTIELPLALFTTADRDGIKRRFDEVHATRYGYAVASEAAEIVSLRSATIGLLRKPPFAAIAAGTPAPPAAAFTGTRPVYFVEAGGFIATPTYDRAHLQAGNRIAGPALIEEYASTTVIHRRDTIEVDPIGNLVITIGRD
jgi:N-methylhydantoinase A